MTLAPLQELLKDNQVVEPLKEQLPNADRGPLRVSPTKEVRFLGVNLGEASLEDLKKPRRLVSKRIKAVSKLK